MQEVGSLGGELRGSRALCLVGQDMGTQVPGSWGGKSLWRKILSSGCTRVEQSGLETQANVGAYALISVDSVAASRVQDLSDMVEILI